MAGVHLVLTGSDLPIPYGILPVSQDEHALAIDRVRFVGDPVALVVARDELTAGEALDLVDVEYEALHTFADPIDSLTRDEPAIHERAARGNVHKVVSLAFGDIGQRPPRRRSRLRGHLLLSGQHASSRSSSTRRWRRCDPDGKLVLWSSTQTPHYVHRALARALAMPAAHIRVIATPNGGGFGGKSDPFNHEIAIAKAALVLDRPVKICLNREEVFYCHRGRHPVLMRLQDRREARRHDHGRAARDAAGRRRLRVRTASRARSIRARSRP